MGLGAKLKRYFNGKGLAWLRFLYKLGKLGHSVGRLIQPHQHFI